jgi:hypothetical protein
VTESSTAHWCGNLSTLSDDQLGLLTQCAVTVIAEGATDEAGVDVAELRELPATVLAPDLAEALRAAGVPAGDQQIERLAGETTSNRTLAIALLEQICAVPALRAEVDAAYTAHQRLMIVDPVTIMAIGLVLLVMKLRRVKVGKDGLDVSLDPMQDVMADVIKSLIGG